MKKSLVALIIILAVILIAGCIASEKQTKKEEIKQPVEKNNTSDVVAPSEPVAAQNNTPQVVEKTPQQKIVDYLKENTPSAFPSFENRILEVEGAENKSILRFRTSTANPAQESLYLLGVQLIVFPDIALANVTGYNSEGKMIISPDSRTQETRTKYWRKYHGKTDWFPNLNLKPECTVDSDCNDKNDCTKDSCLKDGFCSNVVFVSTTCEGIS